MGLRDARSPFRREACRSWSEFKSARPVASSKKCRDRRRAEPRLRDRGRSGLLPSPGEALFDCLPVDGVPPGREVVGPAVLVLQIVGMLPDVHAEDGVLVLHQRAVLVRPAEHLELAAAPYQPAPTGAELADR